MFIVNFICPPRCMIDVRPGSRVILVLVELIAYKVLSLAESTFDRRLEAVAPGPEKYLAKTGLMKERKTI